MLGLEHGIKADLGISVVDQGILASSVFAGNTIGCISAAFLFARFNAQEVLTASFVLHTLATFSFAASQSLYVALLSRVMIGFSFAFIVVYSVVWVDIFAPKSQATTWLGSMNVGVPLGVLTGFIFGGSLIPYLGLSWRWVFYPKVFICIFLIIFLHQSDSILLNEQRPTSQRMASSSLSHQIQIGKTLFKNPIFVCSVASLCSLYFVITSLQIFITNYLKAPPFNATMNTITFAFGMAAITASICGVLAGGLILDKLGGYQGNLHRAAFFAAICGAAAAWLAFLATFMETTFGFIAVMWMMLVAGSATIPVLTGLIMAGVPTNLRSQSSAVANVTFNLGYALGPLFLSSIASAMDGDINLAVHISLMMSAFAGPPMVLNIKYCHAAKLAAEAAGMDTWKAPGLTPQASSAAA